MSDTQIAPRTSQRDTLAHFKTLKKGATINDVAEAFDIRVSSARSRVIRCFENGWLEDREEEGPTGMRRRFFLNAEGKAALRAAN